MQCPGCGSVGPISQGKCPQCGYVLLAPQSLRQITFKKLPETPRSHPNWSLMRGDVLCQGRYRLLEEVPLPGNQQNQGSAWLALDMHATRRRVLLRKLVFPNNISGKIEQVMDALIKRLSVLSEHDGFPALTDVFQERGAYYLVQQYPSGESLASLMQK
ncbi:MAG: hypothetical protein JO215_06450, partial [Ktedonobacteraceae bacterium]|nr:hypothetical protein [Ktedonobacteraceae bacterium]